MVWHRSKAGEVLAIDIGATTIKFCRVDRTGTMLETPKRRSTPYPCTPERLVSLLAARIAEGSNPRVGVGFPGEFADGHVVRPGNLSRPGGVTTEVDPGLAAKWIGFPLEKALRDASGSDVRVVNDARLAALGCCDGHGVELVVTLGTGVGLSMVRDGAAVRVRDVGAAEFLDGRTYDQCLGERARSEDPVAWFALLEKALRGFADEFGAATIHLAGGNAKRVAPEGFSELPFVVKVHGNEAPLQGSAKLFYP